MTKEKLEQANNASGKVEVLKNCLDRLKHNSGGNRVTVSGTLIEGEIAKRIYELCIGYYTGLLEQAEKEFEEL